MPCLSCFPTLEGSFGPTSLVARLRDVPGRCCNRIRKNAGRWLLLSGVTCVQRRPSLGPCLPLPLPLPSQPRPEAERVPPRAPPQHPHFSIKLLFGIKFTLNSRTFCPGLILPSLHLTGRWFVLELRCSGAVAVGRPELWGPGLHCTAPHHPPLEVSFSLGAPTAPQNLCCCEVRGHQACPGRGRRRNERAQPVPFLSL